MHQNTLLKEVMSYLEDDPIAMVEVPDTISDPRHHRVEAVKKVPSRIGLIFGDCLQNLRSTLDYLIYELVVANGGQPNRKHMFPIAMSSDQYERDIQNNKIKGVPPLAAAYIDSLQPFLRQAPKGSPLYFIDELTNLNKHRRPILTGVPGTKKEPLYDFPHIIGLIRGSETPEGPVTDNTVRLWVGLGDDPGFNMEVFTLTDQLKRYVGDEVLPLFEKFFK